MSLRVVFMGTPDFAVPTLSEIVGQGHEVGACLHARTGGRRARHGAEALAGAAHGRAVRPARAHPEDACGARRRRRRFARTADVAVVVAYGMILPQGRSSTRRRSAASTCTPRCCRAGAARHHPARHHGGRRGDRRRRHEDGGGVSIPARSPWSSGWRSTPDMTAGELHDRLMGLGRRSDGAGPRGALARRRHVHAAARGGRHLCAQDHERGGAHRLGKPAAVHDQVRGLSPSRARSSRRDFGKGPERVKVLRTAGEAPASPGRSSTGRHRRLRRGRVAPPPGPARRQAADAAPTSSCAGGGSRRGAADMTAAGHRSVQGGRGDRDPRRPRAPSARPPRRPWSTGCGRTATSSSPSWRSTERAWSAMSRSRGSPAQGGRAAALAPVGVVPAHRRGHRIGLIREGLHRLAEAGEDLVLVLGDPAYYGRFGFTAGGGGAARDPL